MPIDSSDKMRLRELCTKRSSVKGQITKFRNYINTISLKNELNDIEITELRLKLAKFEALAVRLDDLQSEIEVLNSDNITAEIDERDSMENDLILNIATAKNLLEGFSQSNESAEQRRRSSIGTSCYRDHQDAGLKLPQIQIAKFDGSYFRWLEFRDTFESLVHNNHTISPVNKFHYLISYLEGDAARIVTNLEVSSANYEDAWKLLCGRYNNKRILINHHLNALFNIRQLSRESENSLRFLVDNVTKNLRALSSLGQPTDKWDVLLIYMLSSKLDSNTLLKWEEYRNNLDDDVQTLDQFYKFLINRANVLESLNRNRHDNNLNKNISHTQRNIYYQSAPNNQKLGQTFTKSFPGTSNKYNKSSIYTCIICGENHRIYDCSTFKAKNLEQKMADVTKFKLCNNCLRQGHPASECRMGPCQKCNKKHNTLLHRSNISSNVVIDDDDNTKERYSVEQNEASVNICNQSVGQVLLSTAMVEVSNPLTHQKDKVRALLDCGSQSSFITKRLKEKLSINTNSIDSLKIIGIGNNVCNDVAESCNIQLNSMNGKFHAVMSCLVLKELTGHLPKNPVSLSEIKLPKNIQLADPEFHQPAPIDILIGADIFWDILGSEQLSLGTNNPRLRQSKLGWIISGPVSLGKANNKRVCNHALVSQSPDNLDNMLTKFWDLEEIPAKKTMNQKEKDCENHFLINMRRDETGRFIVKLPLKDNSDCLGDSRTIAKRRFINLEKRFKKNNSLKRDYIKFIKEYANLGHLSLSIDDRLSTYYYLPHHAVFKQDSESTKLRVVFDGSARSSSGYYLNDILMTGPKVQDDLISILLRARQHKFLLTADIEKMYRQVLVAKEDRCLQTILWRESEAEPIKPYELNTLTYGTASASYLSTRCLWELGEEHSDPLIKNIIQHDFYVDDLITGSDHENELRYIQEAVSQALERGCFNLRKYKSNHPSIFSDIDINIKDNLTISESSSTLGLGWTPSTDQLHFPIKDISHDKNEVVTKRLIMSKSFKIFDPLGLLSPIVIQPKILLQKLWQYKYDWDSSIAPEFIDEWNKIVDSMHFIPNVSIPRQVICCDPVFIELHSFSDASQSAYGACTYVRSIDNNGKITVRLLCAKSKVAPLKPTTMPRLELCAALVAAKLSKLVLDSLKVRPQRLVHWCDSTIVIAWINNDVTKLKSFAANRVCDILELTNSSSWRYVPTDMNPADLISRGVDAPHLINTDMWWSGPEFLHELESKWPILKVKESEDLPEVKSCVVSTNSEPIIPFDKYSTLNLLQRSFAYVKRFIFNLKNPTNRRSGPLSVEELKESFYYLCLCAQRESFSEEYECLSSGKPLKNKSKILALSPYFDENNLIRVGGRIDASSYSFEKKHPILLHSSHNLTKLYFKKQHLDHMHAGPQLLLATVRETVWPVNGRHLARRTVNTCTRCRRLQGKTLCPKMGDLPAQRVNPDYPFLSVGLDFAGPFMISNRKGRGSRLIKCYLCLFVCLRFKCIHLEAVSDLTRDAFIMTLKRFIARRGKSAEIFCDNGRNFVAAAKEIGSFIKYVQSPVSDFASQQGIKFSFIPAYAPHFGGIWEAGVKSAKHHLRRVLGNNNLTFEEITTVFTQVEAILNSRPLCPLSSCPNDLLSLSPGHFLIGRPLTALPQPAMEDCTNNALKRYARLRNVCDHFWKRWQKEYIGELQQRRKWRTDTARLNVNDMVLLHEDSAPPMQWRLGRVERVFPGPDGVPRVADVITTRGLVRRPLTRLCPLPTAEEIHL